MEDELFPLSSWRRRRAPNVLPPRRVTVTKMTSLGGQAMTPEAKKLKEMLRGYGVTKTLYDGA